MEYMTEEVKQGRPKKYDDPKKAQREANRRYREKNRAKVNYQSKQSAARSFIRTEATIDDVYELRTLLDEREETLKTGE